MTLINGINKVITFIGGGNMARSLIKGLLSNNYNSNKILVSDPNATKLQQLQHDFGINIQLDNKTAAAKAEILIFAVKPQILQNVAVDLAQIIQNRKSLIISITAGIRLQVLQSWLGGYKTIIRSMPNTPTAVAEGMTALYADKTITYHHKKLATAIFNSVGRFLWVENENFMDVITALSGSGPAMIFLVIEALQKAGEKLGLTAESAQQLTLQTVLGAAKLASLSKQDPSQLRKQVTSPNGTTERAIEALESGNLENLFSAAVLAAKQRAEEIANTYTRK